MSTAPHHLSGNGKAPAEKSNFAQTCNRLSLFLKEKGNLRDLSFGINANFDATGIGLYHFVSSQLDSSIVPIRSVKLLKTNLRSVSPKFVTGRLGTSPVITPSETTTVDFLSGMDSHGQIAAQTEKSLNIPRQHASLDSSRQLEDSTNKASSSKPVAVTRSKTAQMTIFYGGQVLVFDDIPADRARELMLAAKGGPPPNGKIENPVELASTSKPPPDVSGSQPTIDAELPTKGSDLPIARRASLHKFLAKRKDRASVRAPYQAHNQSPGASSSGHKHTFDLNL